MSVEYYEIEDNAFIDCNGIQLSSVALTHSKYTTMKLRKSYRFGQPSLQAYETFRATIRSYVVTREVSLVDLVDVYYYGDIGVGTPTQTIRMLFDSGSSDMWIPSSQTCGSNPSYCSSHSVYVPANSETYVSVGTSFRISYGSGAVSGTVSQDDVTISGLTVKGQRFAEASNIQLSNTPRFDGILGMAYPALSNIQTNPPFVNMVEQGLIDNAVFCFYLMKNRTPQLVLGGVNPNHYTGSFTFTPVIERRHWKIQIDGIYLGSSQLLSRTSVIPDSGTSLILGPSSFVERINQAIGADSSGKVVCSTINSLPDVSVVINGKSFILRPSDYIIKVSQRDCISGFDSLPSMPAAMILGHVFMTKYYTQFDMGNNRVGFATAV